MLPDGPAAYAVEAAIKSGDRYYGLRSSVRRAPPSHRFQHDGKKGHKKVGGRKAGKRNVVTRDMKEALLAAAENIGFIHEDAVLDENGKPRFPAFRPLPSGFFCARIISGGRFHPESCRLIR
jgi:hypothetical protein